MKRVLFIPLLFCAMLCMAQNKVSVTPEKPLEKAVSGHYAAWVNGGLSTYGGCNFPNVPCADGGDKVYYPRAYGASVQVPDGTVYLGGMDSTASLSECLFINATDGSTTPIESLPKALDNFAATYYDGMTLEEVAEQIVEECYDLPEIALRYFDYEAFARDLRFDGYTETEHGVICIC